MLNIYKHLVQNGYTLKKSPFGGVCMFILRTRTGDFKVSEKIYAQMYRISCTKVTQALLK